MRPGLKFGKRLGREKRIFAASFMFLVISSCASPGANPDAQTIQAAQMFPLDEYLGAVWGTDLSREEALQRHEAEVERQNELLTQCMHDAGFDAEMVSTLGLRHMLQPAPVPTIELRPNDRAWVAEWGFAIVRANQGRETFWAAEQNWEHSYSDTEVAAFQRAWMGPPCEEVGEITPVAGSAGQASTCQFPADWDHRAQGGCFSQVRGEILDESPRGAGSADEFAPLFRAIDAMQADFVTEVGPEEREWATCMADAGYPGFERRTNPDWPSRLSLPEQQIDNVYSRILRPGRTIENWPELRELYEREIDLALADFDCRVAVDFDTRLATRRTEVETQFVSDHHSALLAIRDAAEQSG